MDFARELAKDLNDFEMTIKRLVAKMNQEYGMGEHDLVKMASEAVYDYFDGLWDFRELVEYTEELGLYEKDQEHPKEE